MKMASRLGQGRKQQTFMIFDHVYSIATDRQFKLLKNEVDKIASVANGICFKANGSPFNHEKIKNSISALFQKSMSSEDVLGRTLLSSLDSDAEEFAHKMDKEIILPLAKDRHDMHSDHKNSVRLLRNRISEILTKRFRGAHLDVYGSCLSGLSLGNASDVDISLYIPGAWEVRLDYLEGKINRDMYQKLMKRFVYKVHDALSPRGRKNYGRHVKKEFIDMEAIPFARVPVVKGNYLHANNPFSHDGSLHFDICILNDIAVANSGLLREYSVLDPRVKMVMLSVKSWIKWKEIGNAAERTLSSYTWMILCIFYLQCIDFLPTLQCPKLMEAHGTSHDPKNRMHTVDNLRTSYLSSNLVLKHGIWRQPDHFKSTPASGLLAGFFLFYARHFPRETTAVSIRLGNLSLQKTVFRSSKLWRLVVEDPFETHDSHCPHDLGTPLDEIGQNKVMDALEEAADKMEEMCINCTEIEDCIGSFRFVEPSTYPEHASHHDPKSEAKILIGTGPGPLSVPDKEKKLTKETNRDRPRRQDNSNNKQHHKEKLAPKKKQTHGNENVRRGKKQSDARHSRESNNQDKKKNKPKNRVDYVKLTTHPNESDHRKKPKKTNVAGHDDGRKEAGDKSTASPKHQRRRNRKMEGKPKFGGISQRAGNH